MAGHDPYELIGRLRDHLSAADSPVSFLMGAGTSSAVNVAPTPPGGGPRPYEPLIPAVDGLTAKVRTACIDHDPDFESAWGAIEAACSEKSRPTHIEGVLGLLRLTTEALVPTGSAFGLTASKLGELENTIQRAIASIAAPTPIPDVLPHDGFAEWIHFAERRVPVEIFTTNYDVLIERSLELSYVPVFDGFVGSFRPFFQPSAMDATALANWTRLWKIHGSVNWASEGGTTIRRDGPSDGSMILPSHMKYDESRKMPYLALMDRLSECVSRPGSLLVTCGYSWGDEHVNATLLGGLEASPTSAIFALMHGDVADDDAVAKCAKAHWNLTVVGHSSGIVRGHLRAWDAPAGTSSAGTAMADYFTATGGPSTSAPTSGQMHLGDFNVFTRFLQSMTTHRPGGRS